jgi:hypothetical protein
VYIVLVPFLSIPFEYKDIIAVNITSFLGELNALLVIFMFLRVIHKEERTNAFSEILLIGERNITTTNTPSFLVR